MAQLSREEVIALHNKGCGKDLTGIWEESICESITNLDKAANPDTGGCPGLVPHSMVDEEKKLRMLSVEAAARQRYTDRDKREKTMRLARAKRYANIRIKSRGGSYQDFITEVCRLTNQTLGDHNKRPDRRELAATIS